MTFIMASTEKATSGGHMLTADHGLMATVAACCSPGAYAEKNTPISGEMSSIIGCARSSRRACDLVP